MTSLWNSNHILKLIPQKFMWPNMHVSMLRKNPENLPPLILDMNSAQVLAISSSPLQSRMIQNMLLAHKMTNFNRK